MIFIKYSVVFVLLVLIELLYLKLAEIYKIVDNPNQRSSHDTVTIRGGGIIFPITVLISFLMGDIRISLFLSLLMVSVVSFIDDLQPVSQKIRFSIHLIAVFLVFHNLNFYNFHWYVPIIGIIVMTGWVNAFNFMDGINGILVLYALVSIGTFCFITPLESHYNFLKMIALSCIVFAFFNVRKKAIVFAGDVGSICMAFLLGFFMVKICVSTGTVSYMLLFSVFGIDSVATIIFRIMRKENIFQPHRTHLYQYLSNEMGFSQISVSIVYAFNQLLINILVLYLINNNLMNIKVFFGVLSSLSIIYLLIRYLVLKKIKNSSKLVIG